MGGSAGGCISGGGGVGGVHIAGSSGSRKRRRNRRTKSFINLEAEKEASAADEMPIVIQLQASDVANIQSSWGTIESILLKVKRVFEFFFHLETVGKAC